MGTISGSGAGKVPQNLDLKYLFQNILRETGPARKLELAQLQEALQTGGVGARIPIIQRAVEAALGAGAQNEQVGRTATARAGLAGTPFDVASQIGTHTETTANAAGIGPAIAAQLIGQGPSMIASATGQGLQAQQMFQQNQQFNAEQIKSFYEDLKQSLEMAGSAAASRGSSPGGGGSPSHATYASIGYGDPSTFNPQGAQFQE